MAHMLQGNDPEQIVTAQTLVDRHVPLKQDESQVVELVAPEVFEVQCLGALDEPDCRASIRIVSGVARVEELTLTAREGGRPVRDKDLRAVQTDRLIRQGLGLVTREVLRRDGGQLQVRAIFLGDARVPTAASSRAGQSDAVLEEVAAAYRGGARQPVKAIMDRFGVSRTTARRWKAEAEDRGFI